MHEGGMGTPTWETLVQFSQDLENVLQRLLPPLAETAHDNFQLIKAYIELRSAIAEEFDV